ncbi:MAG: hypothetical protein WCP33_06960 [Deltaproteobacteria bacterium]
MCGVCIERIALDILKKDVLGSLQIKQMMGDNEHFMRYFYLRETTDFPSALDRMNRAAVRKRQKLSDLVSCDVVLLRGLEILLKHGFESPAYQKLLKKPVYRNAIVTSCTSELRKQFESLTEGLQIEHLGLLFDVETYFWGDRSRQLRTLTDVLPSCLNLLRHYISWWLDGKELKKSDLTAKIKRLGVWDQINKGYSVQTQAAKYERALDFRFDLLERTIYFSILVVGSCSAGKKILLALAQKFWPKPPGFDGVDLWFNRIATLKLYDLEGFDIFSRRVTDIRATCYYYIDLVRGFTIEQKQSLLDEVLRNPEADKTDNYIMMSQWLSEDLGL